MRKLLILVFTLNLMAGYAFNKQRFIKANFDLAETYMNNLIRVCPDSLNYPRTIDDTGKLIYTDMYDWTSGFFAGNLWYLYDYTKNENWKKNATRWTVSLEPLKNYTRHHDLGFMMYCSYGNAMKYTSDKKKYDEVLVQTAKSLISRFSEKTGCIKSWNSRKSLDGKSEWFFPVIIDNMMNLELLFYASKITGDPIYKNIAVIHAETTMKNHFRPDFSTYHVVDYDDKTGKVLNRGAAQGYTDASTWARGQAWAIYGFTMAYRETGDKRFLNTAMKAADFYIHHKNLPKDLVPYWDLNVTDPAFVPVWKKISKKPLNIRDASAAAIISSALFELSGSAGSKKNEYQKFAVATLKSLYENYSNRKNKNALFILNESVGSYPNNVEIDVPLVYADYYYLEALLRYKSL